METKHLKRLPVGIQTFSEIIDLDCLYIDKTEHIWNMINLSKYIFLSRPRRFGKSLLVSTIQAYFEGRKNLFKGLFIDSVEKEWTQYPVLRFDMSTAKHCNKEELELELSSKLTGYETYTERELLTRLSLTSAFRGSLSVHMPRLERKQLY